MIREKLILLVTTVKGANYNFFVINVAYNYHNHSEVLGSYKLLYKKQIQLEEVVNRIEIEDLNIVE